MAVIPAYGRQVAAPGPVPWMPSTGPLYDEALNIIGRAAGDLKDEMADKRRRIDAAHEATEVLGRTANFSLGLQEAVNRARLLKVGDAWASAEEQEGYFRQEADKLAQQYMDWKGASPEAGAKLQERMTSEITRAIGQMREVQMQRKLQDIEANANLTWAAAVRTGNKALATEAADDMVEVDAITPAMRDQQLAAFDTDVRIEQLRRSAEADPAGVFQAAMSLQTQADVTENQRTRLREVENLARGIKIHQKTAMDQATTALLEDALKQAHEIGPAEFQERLLQTVGISETMRAELMKTYLSAAQLYQRTGVNPWTATQDYPSLAQATLDIQTGKIKSLAEINERWLQDGQPNWSFNEWRSLTNAFQSKSTPTDDTKYSRSHPVAEMYFNKLTNLYADSQGTVEDPKTFATKFMLLENALRDPQNWRNPDKMQAAFDGLTKEEKEKKAKRMIAVTGWASLGGKWYPSQMDSPPQLPVFASGDVTVIASHEDAASLPKGTRYVLPNDRNVYEVP